MRRLFHGYVDNVTYKKGFGQMDKCQIFAGG